MRRLSPWITSLLFLVLVPSARAQSGINLYWDGCSDGGTMIKTFACNTNGGSAFVAYASVIVPADIPQLAAASTVIDIFFNGASVPNWWQVGTGQCRAGAISMSFDPAAFMTNCSEVWSGTLPISVFAVQYAVHGVPNELRLNGGGAVPAGQELDIAADGSERVVSRITISRRKTAGTDACTGCIYGACLMLNEIKLQQPLPRPAYTMTTPAWNNELRWNGYTSYICMAGGWDTARNRTWGAVKGMYR